MKKVIKQETFEVTLKYTTLYTRLEFEDGWIVNGGKKNFWVDI